MQAILLAAGYATRLRPLTENRAKPLLSIGGKPIAERICELLEATKAVHAIHVVTNARFAADFRAWAATRPRQIPLHVIDDGTHTNEDRRGALGDIQLVVERQELEGEDLLVVAGDNLLGTWMTDFVAAWRARAALGPASMTAVYDCPDLELVKQYSVVDVDPTGRVRSFVEKPTEPRSHLVGIAAYAFHQEHARLLRTYLAEGNSPDAPGHFLAWLVPRAPLYAYAFAGAWIDIGNAEQLLAADNLVRQAEGRPLRDHYELETA